MHATVFRSLPALACARADKRRILAAVEGRSAAAPTPPRPFIGVPPRMASFIGRARELDTLDAHADGGSQAAPIHTPGLRIRLRNHWPWSVGIGAVCNFDGCEVAILRFAT